ncbi:MAG TPA: hypothetical protein VEZ88_13235 [Steroidobacteraceae bacterium]|nr:hypothetical protein [Steroidobacteraceae bacterium]
MRVSDDRYTRDRLRFDLALRMIHHEARTCTIRSWTGLTDDRIRKLYRTYLQQQFARTPKRHRGKSPRQIAYFLRSPSLQFEATTLASLFALLGLISPALEPHRALPLMNLESGDLFCVAYESYLALHAAPRISFEHAGFLLIALRRQDELKLRVCSRCRGLSLVDVLAVAGPECAACGQPSAARRRAIVDASGLLPTHRDWSPGISVR